MKYLAHYGRNEKGRDFVIGDIHGQFTRVEKAIAAIRFNPDADRLFSVGDLIDRGPECERVIEWLDKPWFFPVRGNHEDYACRYQTVDGENWLYNGGGWFMGLPSSQQAEIGARLNELPLAIELETSKGMIGIVHADVPGTKWSELPSFLESRKGRDYCMWSRGRINSENDGGVQGIRAVVVGHTPLDEIRVLGNVIHIDTGGWRGVEGSRKFTILDVETLEPAQCL